MLSLSIKQQAKELAKCKGGKMKPVKKSDPDILV